MRGSKQLLSRMMRRREVMALVSWRAVAKEMGSKEDAARRAMARLLHAAEARAFALWREMGSEVAREKAAMGAAIARWQQQALTRCFLHWREQAAAETERSEPQPEFQKASCSSVYIGRAMGRAHRMRPLLVAWRKQSGLFMSFYLLSLRAT